MAAAWFSSPRDLNVAVSTGRRRAMASSGWRPFSCPCCSLACPGSACASGLCRGHRPPAETKTSRIFRVLPVKCTMHVDLANLPQDPDQLRLKLTEMAALLEQKEGALTTL